MIKIGDSWDPFERIKETVENLNYLDSLSDSDRAIFEECSFAKTVSIVPLAIVGFTKSLSFDNIPNYLSTINFPFGQEISDFIPYVSTYIPLTRADLTESSSLNEKKIRRLADQYSSLLKRNISEDKEFYKRIGNNVCALLLSEMTDNIYEHSIARNVFIFSQYWRKNDSCEICLADNGIGIYQSLKKANRNVIDDLDAIEKVIETFLSAKDEYGSQKRGTGIKNTIRLLSNNELNGYFCVISGKAGYFVDSRGRKDFLNLQNISWNGTLVNMRF